MSRLRLLEYTLLALALALCVYALVKLVVADIWGAVALAVLALLVRLRHRRREADRVRRQDP